MQMGLWIQNMLFWFDCIIHSNVTCTTKHKCQKRKKRIDFTKSSRFILYFLIDIQPSSCNNSADKKNIFFSLTLYTNHPLSSQKKKLSSIINELSLINHNTYIYEHWADWRKMARKIYCLSSSFVREFNMKRCLHKWYTTAQRSPGVCLYIEHK